MLLGSGIQTTDQLSLVVEIVLAVDIEVLKGLDSLAVRVDSNFLDW